MAKTKSPNNNPNVDRRAKTERRAKAERRASDVPVADDRRKQDRRKVRARRQIDPTTCERDYTQDEIEFMQALDDYKRTNGRMFPTCSEILEVVRALGYVRSGEVTGQSQPGETAISSEFTESEFTESEFEEDEFDNGDE